DKIAALVKEKIAAREKAAAEKLAQDKLGEQIAERERKAKAQAFREKARAEDAAAKKAKTKAKTFADIAKLPVGQQDSQIAELAKQLDEDPDILAAEFAEYRGGETEVEIKISDWEVEPWPEPIATAVVLEELIATINRHIVAKRHEVLAIALWFMFAW